MSCRIAAAGILVSTLLTTVADGADALLEFEVNGNSYVGKSLRHDQDYCWLLGQDGRLHQVPLDGVTSYRKISNTFRAISTSALRSRLREELGRDYEVTGRGKFVVAARTGQAQPYADLLDGVYRSFVRFFSRRDFHLSDPEVPLMAIVFADARQFADYCRQDGVQYHPTLRGYYHPDTNRIALYDPDQSLAIRIEANNPQLTPTSPDDVMSLTGVDREFASIQADLRDTLVHEATHQLAFNMGLHSRIGENPRWVVEGLALIFERELSVAPGSSRAAGINEARYYWFNTRLRPDWTPGALKQFLASDRPFTTTTLDAYSLAWALTYYLTSRRSSDFAAYLQALRERDDAGRYGSDERLSDFQQHFGNDIDWLEVQLLRYIDALE